VVIVEYFRDVRPILARSCVACHTHKAEKPPAGLVLDDDHLGTHPAFGHDAGPDLLVPSTYFRLAAWKRYTEPPAGAMVTPQAASPYITMFQSRRSPLVWKIYGRRLDGWTNDDLPSITKIGDLKSLRGPDGKPIAKLDYDDEKALRDYVQRFNIDRDFTGSVMPPPEAVKEGKVKALSDEDRRTIVRWIDLGCPIDLDPAYDPAKPDSRSYGWLGDDQRPTLTLTYPQPGVNAAVDRILIGMTDAYSGIDAATFTVTADLAIDGTRPGDNLAGKFRDLADGRWEWKLNQPLTSVQAATLTVAVQDRQGNLRRIERKFSAGKQ
jgi:hypothetical protein